MLELNKRLIPFIIILIFSRPLFAQQTTLDWKLHDVGKVRQVVTNTGGINATPDLNTGAGLHDYPGLINCEFPPNSQEEHILEAGIRIGAIVGGDTLVSVPNGNNGHLLHEFFASADPVDTIWVANKGDTLDIPYWPGYTAVSDQDFICKYSDYHVTNISSHKPLYVDVIQTSYAWSSFPIDNIIVFNYYITPTRFDLHKAYITYMLQGRIGDRLAGERALDDDDVSLYFPEHHMASIQDLPGGADGTAISPIAIKLFPPEAQAGSLNWTFIWNQDHHAVPERDPLAYEQLMASHVIMTNQTVGGGPNAIFSLSFGPFELSVGDTLHFIAAEILGNDMDEILKTAERVDALLEKDFKLPTAPPVPPVRVEVRDNEVTINWKPQAGDINPELYTDPNRADGVEHPFEGYRVYKSTLSATGPWTLLAEFDLPDNDIGFNTGLAYEFADIGLLNNLEYYYSVTAYSRADTVLDFPQLESSINRIAQTVVPGTPPPPTVGEVAVVPNPYRGDIAYQSFNPPWEKPDRGRSWVEQDRRILFVNLPAQSEIKIYTLAGDLVDTIRHNDPIQGYESWNLTSFVGQAISSGIFLFTVENTITGEVQVGKFVIIK